MAYGDQSAARSVCTATSITSARPKVIASRRSRRPGRTGSRARRCADARGRRDRRTRYRRQSAEHRPQGVPLEEVGDRPRPTRALARVARFAASRPAHQRRSRAIVLSRPERARRPRPRPGPGRPEERHVDARTDHDHAEALPLLVRLPGLHERDEAAGDHPGHLDDLDRAEVGREPVGLLEVVPGIQHEHRRVAGTRGLDGLDTARQGEPVHVDVGDVHEDGDPATGTVSLLHDLLPPGGQRETIQTTDRSGSRKNAAKNPQ